MNVNAFSQKIKEKYPEYKDWDNIQLTKAIIKKYPEYGSWVTFPKEDKRKERIGETQQRLLSRPPTPQQPQETIQKATGYNPLTSLIKPARTVIEQAPYQAEGVKTWSKSYANFVYEWAKGIRHGWKNKEYKEAERQWHEMDTNLSIEGRNPIENLQPFALAGVGAVAVPELIRGAKGIAGLMNASRYVSKNKKVFISRNEFLGFEGVEGGAISAEKSDLLKSLRALKALSGREYLRGRIHGMSVEVSPGGIPRVVSKNIKPNVFMNKFRSLFKVRVGSKAKPLAPRQIAFKGKAPVQPTVPPQVAQPSPVTPPTAQPLAQVPPSGVAPTVQPQFPAIQPLVQETQKGKVPPGEPPSVPPAPPAEPPEKPKFIRPKETKTVVMKEGVALRERLRSEARGAKFGYRAGRQEARQQLFTKLKSTKKQVAEIKHDLVSYAQQNLSLNDRGKLLSKVKTINTKHGLVRAMQMIDIMEEKYQRRESVGKLVNTIKRIDLKKVRPEYKQEIENIVSNLDLVNRREKTLGKLSGMKKFIEEHPDNNIPEDKLKQLGILDKKKIKDLTVDDIDLIRQSVLHFKKLNDLKNKMIFGRVYKEAKEVLEQSYTNIARKKKQKYDPQVIDTKDTALEAGRIEQIFTTESWNAETISKILDKEPRGVIKAVVYDGPDEGTSDMLQFQQSAKDYFRQQIPFDISRWTETSTPKPSGKTIDYQSIKLPSGKTIKMTKGERLAFYLHSLNNKNLKHILEGGTSFEKNRFRIDKISGDDLDAIINSMTDEEHHVANVMYAYLNKTQKQKLNERSLELNGTEVATEIDYFPIRTNALDIKRDELKLQKNFTQKTLEGMGILKERTNASNALIIEDAFSAVYKSIKQSSAYYGLAKPLRNVKMMLNDKKFQQDITRTYGKHYLRALNSYVKDIEGNSYDLANVDKLTNDLINRLDIAVLGANPWVMFKQTISLGLALTEIDFKYILKGIFSPGNIEEMSKWSPQLRDRFEGNVTRELGEIGQVGEVRKFWTGKSNLGQKLMSGISTFDRWVIRRIWGAVVHETNELSPQFQGEDKMKYTAKRTEEVVRLTQPTFMPKDRSSIGRSKQTSTRLLTKYSSQRNKNYMILKRSVEKYNRSGKTAGDKATLIKSLALVMIVANAMLIGVDEARNRAYGRKPPKRRGLNNVLRFLEINLGNVYFVGTAFSTIKSKIEKGTYAGRGISNVLYSTVDTGMNAIADLYKTIDQVMSKERYKAGDKRGERKWKTSMKKAIDESLSVVSKFKGIPYDTIKKTVKIPFTIGKKPKSKRKLRRLD